MLCGGEHRGALAAKAPRIPHQLLIGLKDINVLYAPPPKIMMNLVIDDVRPAAHSICSACDLNDCQT